MQINSNWYRILKDNKGESLVSVMIAVGIMALVMTASSYLFTNLMKAQKTLTVRGNMENIVGEIKMALGADNICKINLQGKSVPAPSATGVTSITSLKYLDSTGTSLGTQNIVSVGATPADIEIISMGISDTKVAAPGVLIGRLSVQMKGTGVIGVDTITRSMPIQLTVDAGNVIQDCKSVTQSGDVDITVTSSSSTPSTTTSGECPEQLLCTGPSNMLSLSVCGNYAPCKFSSSVKFKVPKGFPTQVVKVKSESYYGKYMTGIFTCQNAQWSLEPCPISGGDGDGTY